MKRGRKKGSGTAGKTTTITVTQRHLDYLIEHTHKIGNPPASLLREVLFDAMVGGFTPVLPDNTNSLTMPCRIPNDLVTWMDSFKPIPRSVVIRQVLDNHITLRK